MNAIAEFVIKLSENIIWFGDLKNKVSSIKLNAGKLSMIYENGSLRYISAGKHEIIRMIYSAVRDKAWLTATPLISDEKIDIAADSFSISYNCRYQLDEIDFFAQYSIQGKNDSSLIFEMNGEALSSFYKNRIGFCILHPVNEIAGKPCTILHSDQSETDVFPLHIKPNQPFKDISGMKWKCNNIQASLEFTGDVFETEDQRNWTDASYKTYCTPLDRPFPVWIEKGEFIHQKIGLKADLLAEQNDNQNEHITIQLFPEETYSMPLIGIGQSTRKLPIQQEEISIFQKIPFDHYRTDIYLFDKYWQEQANNAVEEAMHLGFSLEIGLFFSEDADVQISEFIEWKNNHSPKISHILIFHETIQSTPESLLEKVIPKLRKSFPGVSIGSGTNANFAQLNRSQPKMNDLDFLTFSIHPQEHAFDNASLVENMEAQRYAIESAKQFSNGKGIRISPVNLARRFNANISNFEEKVENFDYPPQVDNRIMSLFGASWTVGSVKYLCESEVESFTFYETVGERGIVQGMFPSQWPLKFASVSGMIFPVFYVFEFLLKHKNFKIVKSVSSHPLLVESFILTDGELFSVLIVSFSSNEIILNSPGLKGEFNCKTMHAGNFSSFACDENWFENEIGEKISLHQPFTLLPYSVNFLTQI